MCIGYRAMKKHDKIVTRNIYINRIYVFLWFIKHVGNKVWSGYK